MFKIQGYRTKLVRERTAKYSLPLDTVDTPHHAAAAATALIGDSDREHVLCFWLDNENKILGYQEVARGGIAGCALMPADVLRGALVGGARAIVLAHNHPSGDPTPSPDDISMTHACDQACEVVGIKLLDHVVVTRDGAFESLRARRDF